MDNMALSQPPPLDRKQRRRRNHKRIRATPTVKSCAQSSRPWDQRLVFLSGRATKQPYNFVGSEKPASRMPTLSRSSSLVGAEDTIHFRIFPHYRGAYLNIDKVSNGEGLMRQMVRFTDQNFLFWGADSSGDIFAGFNFTLESGFPEASVRVVLNSVSKLDVFVGQMRPSIDGSAAP